MSEKSKGDVSSSSSTSSPRIVKNPLLSASVTGLSFDDFPNKPQLLPAAPPIVHAPPQPPLLLPPQPIQSSHINPTLLTAGILNREAKTLVTVGSAATLDADDNLDEINLDSTFEEQQQTQQQQRFHLHPFALDANANSNLTNTLLEEPVRPESESILSQAASSFTALPAVASNVFSTFSKRIYSSATNSGSNSRERTPFNEQPQQQQQQQQQQLDEINANSFLPAQLDLQPSYIQQQQQQFNYQTTTAAAAPPSLPSTFVGTTGSGLSPFVPTLGAGGEGGPSLPQLTATSILTEDKSLHQSGQPLPEPPKFYTPTELRSLPSASLNVVPPSGVNTNTQNTYRSTTKKKFYAPIPGLSSQDKPPAQQKQTNILASAAPPLLPPSSTATTTTTTFLTPPYPEASSITQQPFDLQAQTPIPYHNPYLSEFKQEERKPSGGGGLFTGVLQNLTGLVQSAAGSLAYQAPEVSPARQIQSPSGPEEVSLTPNSYFVSPTLATVQQPPPPPPTGYFTPSTPLQQQQQQSVSAAQPLQAAAPPIPQQQQQYQQQSVEANQANQTLGVGQPLLPPTSQQTVGSLGQVPPPPIGQTSFRLQKGTRLYKNPLTQQETAPAVASPLLNQQPLTNYQQKPLGIFNPFEGTTTVLPAPAPTPPLPIQQHQPQPIQQHQQLQESFVSSSLVTPSPLSTQQQQQEQQLQQQQTLPPLPPTIFNPFPTKLGEEVKVEPPLFNPFPPTSGESKQEEVQPQAQPQQQQQQQVVQHQTPTIFNPFPPKLGEEVKLEPSLIPPASLPIQQQQQQQQQRQQQEQLQQPAIFNPFPPISGESKQEELKSQAQPPQQQQVGQHQTPTIFNPFPDANKLQSLPLSAPNQLLTGPSPSVVVGTQQQQYQAHDLQQQLQQQAEVPLEIFNPFASSATENKELTHGFAQQNITAPPPPEFFNPFGQTTATTTTSITHLPVSEQLTEQQQQQQIEREPEAVTNPPVASSEDTLNQLKQPFSFENLIIEPEPEAKPEPELKLESEPEAKQPSDQPLNQSTPIKGNSEASQPQKGEEANQTAAATTTTHLSQFFIQSNNQRRDSLTAGPNFFESQPAVEDFSYQEPTAPIADPSSASNFFSTQPPLPPSSAQATESFGVGFVIPTAAAEEPINQAGSGVIHFNSDHSLALGFDNLLIAPNNTGSSKEEEAASTEKLTNFDLNKIENNCQNIQTVNPISSDLDSATGSASFSKYFSNDNHQNSYVNSFLKSSNSNNDNPLNQQSTINAVQPPQQQQQQQQQQNQGLLHEHQQQHQENLLDSSKFFDSFASTAATTIFNHQSVGSQAVPPSLLVNENLIDGNNGNVTDDLNQSTTSISNEDQRIQNFFNNPPPKENSAGIGDLNYDLVHSGLAVKNLETRSQTSISNLVEPPSSACSDFSELNNLNIQIQQQQIQEQQQQAEELKREDQPSRQHQQQFRAVGGGEREPNHLNRNVDLQIEDILNRYSDPTPKLIEMANAQVESLANLTYTPVVRHWFYTRLVDNKLVWQPFSHYDSALLETSLMSAENDNATDDESGNLVPVEGGRYDVNIRERTKRPVYWEGSGIEVRRCSWFYKGVDSKYAPYDEETADLLEAKYKNCFDTGVWHQKVELATGDQWVMIHGPLVIVHFHQQHNVDAWGGVSQTSVRPRVVKRDLLDFKIEQGESQRVDHLLFMVHGIGSACDLKMRTVEEVVGDFREIAQHLIQSHYKNSSEMGIVGRVEVLPISWHSHLHSEELGIDEKLKSITLESIPKLRNFTNDTLLDVLFYTSPTFCQKIMNTVAKSLNEVYLKYRSRHPDFNGGVSLAGHSLGSLILFDLLCHQEPIKECEEQNMENPDQPLQAATTTTTTTILNGSHDAIPKQISYTMGPAGTGQPYISYNQLIFQPKKFFALGSPIGMFVTIRGIDKLGLDFRLPTCPGFYNIFHPFDPVAYRIEALVNPDMTGIRPVLIPHHKGRKRMHLELKETMTRVGADLKQRFFDTFKNTLESVNFLTPNSKAKKEAEETMEKEVNSMLQMQMQIDQQEQEQQQQQQQQQNDEVLQSCSSQIAAPSRPRTESVSTTVSDSDMVEVDFPLGKLNDSKRVDYVLQEAPLEFINEYFFALSSHVCYWESEDTILFVMKEIYAGLGISPDSQVPQQSMTIERPSSRNSVSQTLLPL